MTELMRRFDAFVAQQPYEYFSRIDAGRDFRGLKFMDIPPEITVVVSDVVSTLRAGFDHAVQAALCAAHIDYSSGKTKFPVAKQRDLISGRGDVPEELWTLLIKALKPHLDHDGNSAFVTLNEMRNEANHRHLVKMRYKVIRSEIRDVISFGGPMDFGPFWHPEWQVLITHSVQEGSPTLGSHPPGQIELVLGLANTPEGCLDNEPALDVFKAVANNLAQLTHFLDAWASEKRA